MLIIRLSRRGKKKQPTYRIVVMDKRKKPTGLFKEDLGFYNPKTKSISLKVERIKYWLEKGAQTSTTVHNLLVKEKVINQPKIKLTFKKKEKEETTPPESTPETKTEEKTTS